MEEPSPQVLIGGLAFWSLIVGVPIFFIILFLLPEDAYGEEDVRVAAREIIQSRSRTQVLVLGDIGRSPRMQYHALSIARHGVAVDLIGYTESTVHPAIAAHKYITIYPIDKMPSWLQRPNHSLFILIGPLKVIYQAFSLWQILGHRTRPAKWLLVQNPPSIPVLAIAAVVCWLRKTKLVIDWHNFGYSILALKLGKRHPMVRLSWIYERFWAGFSTANFVVSDAMKRKLRREFGIKGPVITVHDRPMDDFKPMETRQRELFLNTLELTMSSATDVMTGRKRLVVSSTSWTPDEDFSVLLDALIEYSAIALNEIKSLPSLLVIITGKGPQKEMYLERISDLQKRGKLARVEVKTVWLSNADYAGLLGAADLGVSLHKSSSGVDLPMKVVDMFGAGLPVVGWGLFEAWSELVKDGSNGRSFGTAEELRSLLIQLFGPDETKLATLKKGAMMESRRGWDAEWNSTARPTFGLTDANIIQPR